MLHKLARANLARVSLLAARRRNNEAAFFRFSSGTDQRSAIAVSRKNFVPVHRHA
jgi:hypothetical protein